MLHLFDQEGSHDSKKSNLSDLPVSDVGVSKLATVGSGDGSLGDGESGESGGSELGDAGHGGACLSLQVVNCELSTYTTTD